MLSDNPQHSRRIHSLLCVAALTGWVGLAVQLYIILGMRLADGSPLVPGLVNFFSFFTVLTNTLVAVVLTHHVTPSKGRARAFFLHPIICSGITASILLVSGAYSLLLRNLWTPQGWQMVADELLHDVMPLVFFAYWLLAVAKGSLRLYHLLGWMLYPALYLGYALLRGKIAGVYQYPFLDVPQLGYAQVLKNAFGILLGFILISLVLYGLDRWLGRRRASRP